ncbi:MAG: hypothetical protein U9Q38_04630 [Thermodesulfobacteriota bacterium]|nr:hypothetical protein [Thermodesulfobacteriota bacterium]
MPVDALNTAALREMNFKKITDKVLALAVKKINHKPRKCFDYQTPREVYYQALRGAVAT